MAEIPAPKKRDPKAAVIGIGGTYCAGKSSVGAWLAERGWLHIEVDQLGHQALEVLATEIVAHFGQSILDSDGRIDRRRLGKMVFSDPERLKALEALVHPWMRARAVESIDQHQQGPVILNAALLFRMRMDSWCQPILWITAPYLSRLIRAMQRDKLHLKLALRRLSAEDKPQFLHQRVDICIVDNRNFSGTQRKVEAILERYI